VFSARMPNCPLTRMSTSCPWRCEFESGHGHSKAGVAPARDRGTRATLPEASPPQVASVNQQTVDHETVNQETTNQETTNQEEVRRQQTRPTGIVRGDDVSSAISAGSQSIRGGEIEHGSVLRVFAGVHGAARGRSW
jgi:hypothetical protein